MCQIHFVLHHLCYITCATSQCVQFNTTITIVFN
jgi:hypothetical protein